VKIQLSVHLVLCKAWEPISLLLCFVPFPTERQQPCTRKGDTWLW
jgi:hypothetical protein